ncbi:MAG: TlpA disulfide reductase family protein [Kofleriaceae bacterium]|nr:TlpA disulfide reductase family protein [Kofleriaceae bacterium]
MSTFKVLLALLLFAGACTKSEPSKNDQASSSGGGPAKPGSKCQGANCLPDVKYVDTIGKAYTPENLTGKVVVVNFWATWCKPCLKEIPDLSKVQERYKDKGVVILGLMTDNPDSQQLLNFQSDNEMTYPVVRVNSDILVSYNYPESLPTTFVFDRTGKQVFSHVGAVSEQKLVELLEPLIAQKL